MRVVSGRAPRVAVFDADFSSTLALVGSLGAAGVPLIVFHHRSRCALRFSRYVHRVYPCPDPCDADRFPVWLARQLAAGVFDLIAPTSDAICFHLAESIQHLPERYRARLPTRGALLDVLFKDRLAGACERHGIATPATRTPHSLDEALAAAEAIGYPVLVKPRSHVCNPSERGGPVHDPAQLRAVFGPYRVPADQRALVARYPGLAWPLVQEYVARDRPQLSCSGLLAADGRLVTGAATVKLDQSPRATGTGTAFASYHDDALVADCADIVSRLLGRGLFEIEVLHRCHDGPPLVIDINPRVFGQVGFDIARRNDLPKRWYDAVRGEVSAATTSAKPMVCVSPGPFVLANLTRIATGPGRWQWCKRMLRLLRATRSCIGWNRRDPVASVLLCLRPLRHPTTFIRSHIRERGDA